MKVLLFAIVLTVLPTVAFAQPGVLGIYADAGGMNCNTVDNVTGLLTVWVVHTMTGGSIATQFSAPQPDCLEGVYLSDTAPWPICIGNSQTGFACGHGTCLTGTIALLAINYFAQGLTPACCFYPVLPDPNVPSGEIEMVDCGNNIVYATGLLHHTINGDETCDCTVSTGPSTWGHIKALYAAE